MRRTTRILAALLLANQSSAFHLTFTHHRRVRHSPTSRLFSSSSTEGKKSLSSADILARARKAAGVSEPVEEEIPKLFEDALLDDMQQCLLTLEKRVREGPGSIPLLEIEQFQAMTNNILGDMKEKENERLDTLSSGSAPLPVAPTPQLEASLPPAVGATAAVINENVGANEEEAIDTSEDDGPAYTGSGGMGLAKGTANTWIIDGMDSMSPEEYQKAIQASVSARQAKRKESGVYGNRATNDYLNNLGGNSGGGMLKKG